MRVEGVYKRSTTPRVCDSTKRCVASSRVAIGERCHVPEDGSREARSWILVPRWFRDDDVCVVCLPDKLTLLILHGTDTATQRACDLATFVLYKLGAWPYVLSPQDQEKEWVWRGVMALRSASGILGTYI
jgi:hypothetical protein